MSEQAEELEVLQSILEASDLSQLNDDEIAIRIEPEMDTPGYGQYMVSLHVSYTPAYPSEPPGLKIEPVEGDLDESDITELETSVRAEAEASLGMAMVYTLTMTLRETLTALLATKSERAAQVEADAAQAAHEAEQARTRGTPVTPESFNAWRDRFNAEMKLRRIREEDDKIKALPPKEREEVRRAANKLTGKQLFEKNRNLDVSDAAVAEGQDVDLSKYDRSEERDDESDEDSLVLSDSD